MERFLGNVTIEEVEEVKLIQTRKTALIELLATQNIHDSDNSLYEKVLADIGICNNNLANWWKKTSKKYNWSFGVKDVWKLDYEACKVFLITPDEEK